ncbi:unnamed protein product, partial [Rotaria socialis]
MIKAPLHHSYQSYRNQDDYLHFVDLSVGVFQYVKSTAGNILWETFITRNASILKKTTRLFTKYADHQPSLDIKIFEGERVKEMEMTRRQIITIRDQL